MNGVTEVRREFEPFRRVRRVRASVTTQVNGGLRVSVLATRYPESPDQVQVSVAVAGVSLALYLKAHDLSALIACLSAAAAELEAATAVAA